MRKLVTAAAAALTLSTMALATPAFADHDDDGYRPGRPNADQPYKGPNAGPGYGNPGYGNPGYGNPGHKDYDDDYRGEDHRGDRSKVTGSTSTAMRAASIAGSAVGIATASTTTTAISR